MNKHTLKIFLICVTLLLVAAAQPVLGSDWAQFQKDVHNTGVTADRGPITDPMNCSLSWNYSMGGNIDVTPVVAGDITYVVASNNHLCAFNRTTGTLLWEESTSGGGFLLGNLAIGNGIVFVPTVDGKIFAFDAETGSPKWNRTLSSKQLDTPILYYDGKIYFGEAMGGRKYYCLDEDGNEIWNRTATTQSSGQGSYYWAGAAVIGDSLVYGDDDGHLVSLNKDTGTDIAEIDVSEEFGITCKEIRSSVLYVEELNRIYFTSKGGYCYSLGFNVADGTFNTSEKHIANIGYSTSTPAYYNGRIYVGAGGMYGGGSGISCLDADLTDEIWHYAAGAVQSSPAISAYYDDGDGEVYVYFTVNSATGGVFCLKDYTGCTNPELAWSYADASKTAYTLAGAVISDGWIYYGTDKRYLFGFTNKEGQNSSTPVANFSANPLSGDAPLTVQFTDLSSGDGINAWAWDFDNDGNVDSTEQNPSHTYTSAGTYTVNLTVENAAGFDFELKSDYIEVSETSGSTVTLYFDPASSSVAENELTEISIVASNFPAGFSGYNLTVEIDDPAIAEIIDIEYPSWALITENSSLPGTSIYLKAVDGEDDVQAGAANVVLATLTVSGKESGSANLSIGVDRLDDDSGNAIEPAFLTGKIEVTLLSPLPDQEYAPKDLDGDGLYEDLTGNGEFSFVDIVAYFHNMDWIEENTPVEYFDFNGNGRIDFDDVVDMFAMI